MTVIEKKTIYPGVRIRNNKIWIDFRYKGIRCREPFGRRITKKNIEDAKTKREAILYAINMQRFNYIEFFPDSKKIEVFGGRKNSRLTIAEAIDTWFKRFKKKGGKSNKTYKIYQADIRNNIKPYLGDILLHELTTEQLDTWIASLSCTDKNKMNIMTPLKGMLFDAMKYKQISTNPIIYIDKIKVKNPKPNPLCTTEVDNLLSALSGGEKNFYEFAIWTGLSTGEQIPLYWEDVDFHNRVISIRRAYDKDMDDNIGKTKNDYRTRTIELLEPAWQALKRQQKITGKKQLVFINPNNNKMWSYGALSKVWNTGLKEIGAEKRAPYQTRHTYASIILSAGLPIAWLKQQMGHSSLEMIDKRYAAWLSGADKVRAWVKQKTQNGHNGNEFNAFFFK